VVTDPDGSANFAAEAEMLVIPYLPPRVGDRPKAPPIDRRRGSRRLEIDGDQPAALPATQPGNDVVGRARSGCSARAEGVIPAYAGTLHAGSGGRGSAPGKFHVQNSLGALAQLGEHLLCKRAPGARRFTVGQ